MGKGAGTRHETAFGGMLFTAGGTGKQQRRHPSLLGNSFLGPPWMAVREAGLVGIWQPGERTENRSGHIKKSHKELNLLPVCCPLRVHFTAFSPKAQKSLLLYKVLKYRCLEEG